VVFGIADLYRKLGGEIEFKCSVKDVVIEENRAVGVKLENGSERHADIIVWAADGHTLIFDILGGRYIDERIKSVYQEWIPVKPIVHVMLGVNRDLSDEPARLVFELDKPINIAGEEHHWMSMIHHCFDPSAVLKVNQPWRSGMRPIMITGKLIKGQNSYENEKKRIADFTISQLDKRLPGFASQVEVVDVPTPATYVRYTGNWQDHRWMVYYSG